MARYPKFPENFYAEGCRLFNAIMCNQNAETNARCRHWLDAAPACAQVLDFDNWGSIMDFVLNNVERSPKHEKHDARRLGEYFSAFVDFAEQGQQANNDKKSTDVDLYNACHSLLKNALGSGVRNSFYKEGDVSNPGFKELIQQNWNADALITALSKVQHLCTNKISDGYRDTSIGTLYRILWPLMYDTTWRPSDNGLYSDMLSMQSIDASLRGATCAVHFSKSVPSRNAVILEKIWYSTNLAPESIGPFFPMALSTCEAYPVLDSLLSLLTDGGRDDPTYKALIVAEQLRVHHPDLSSLLSMHLALFPEACESSTFAEMLVPGLNALYRRPVEVAEIITGDFFDDELNTTISL